MTWTPAAFAALQQLMEVRAGISLSSSDAPLATTRLTPLLATWDCQDFAALLQNAGQSGAAGLARQIVESMLTHETRFFRNRAAFDYLRDQVLPDLTRRADRPGPIRIWCAASSTGQEPYSIALTAAAFDESLVRERKIEIIATDLSTAALATARAGTYSELEIARDVPAKLRAEYLCAGPEGLTVREDLRAAVTFQVRDITRPLPFARPFDVVFACNVLIYFGAEARRQAFANARDALAPTGYLFFGPGEGPPSGQIGFDVVDANARCFQRVNAARQLSTSRNIIGVQS